MPRKKSGSFDENRYKNEYQKENYKRVSVLIPKSEKDIIDKLDKVESKSSYILSLIKKDLDK